MGNHGIRIIRWLLTNSVQVTALVAAENIQADILPDNTVLPAILLDGVSSVPLQTLSAGSTMYFRDRIQVTSKAATYDEIGTINEAIFKACRYRFPVMADLSQVCVIPDGEGPDGYDPLTFARMKPLDFIVRYNALI
jgi:hypothetical protein